MNNVKLNDSLRGCFTTKLNISKVNVLIATGASQSSLIQGKYLLYLLFICCYCTFHFQAIFVLSGLHLQNLLAETVVPMESVRFPSKRLKFNSQIKLILKVSNPALVSFVTFIKAIGWVTQQPQPLHRCQTERKTAHFCD